VPLTSDADLRRLLAAVRTIAVLGMKAAPEADAFRVPVYLQRQGYRIRPVSPKLERVLGERAVACLADLAETPDLVDVFRAPEHVPGHVEEILAMRPLPRGVWLQLGIRHDEAAARLEAAGVAVVEDRCIMVEHRRLLGGAGGRSPAGGGG
jgi:predicted CoA-binding protein